jgi:hypothetical protein
MSLRSILGALAAVSLLAPPAFSQSIINPPSGASGASGCPTATPCTVEQKIAPASTSANGLIVNLPSGTSAAILDLYNNNARKGFVGSAGEAWFNNSVRVALGGSIGWQTDPSSGISRTQLYGGGSSGCTGHLQVASDTSATVSFTLNPKTGGVMRLASRASSPARRIPPARI